MRSFRVVCIAMCAIAVLGCLGSPASPAIKGVIGTVTWNAAPVPGTTVRLIAAPGSSTDTAVAEAVTDSTGHFELDGAPAGKYTVYAYAPTPDFIAWIGSPVTVPESGAASLGTMRLAKKMTTLTPINGDNAVAQKPTVSWNAFPGAESYHVDIFLNKEPWTAVLRLDVGAVTSFTLPAALDAGQPYQWSVSAKTAAAGEIAVSAGNSFTVAR